MKIPLDIIVFISSQMLMVYGKKHYHYLRIWKEKKNNANEKRLITLYFLGDQCKKVKTRSTCVSNRTFVKL